MSWSLKGKEVPYGGFAKYTMEDIETLRQKLIDDFTYEFACETRIKRIINKRFGVDE